MMLNEKAGRRPQRLEAGSRRRSEEHPGGGDGRVRGQRPVRRAHRRDRGEDAHVEAHDLLLFRRQGRALRPRARGGLPPGARRRAGAGARPSAAGRGAQAAGRVHLRPSQPPSGFHPHRDDRKHPSRRVSRAVRADPAAECGGDPEAGGDLPPRPRRPACSAKTSRRSSCIGTSARRASSTSPTAPPSRAFSAARCTPPTGSDRCEIIWWRWSSALRSNPSARRDACAYDAPRPDRCEDPSIGASWSSAPCVRRQLDDYGAAPPSGSNRMSVPC